MTIRKAQNNTVNTYINTKAFHTQPSTIWLRTDTCTLTLTSSQARAHNTHTHTHSDTYHTNTNTHTQRHTTHTHTQQMKKRRQQQALLLVPCFASPPPKQPMPTVTISETQVKAVHLTILVCFIPFMCLPTTLYSLIVCMKWLCCQNGVLFTPHPGSFWRVEPDFKWKFPVVDILVL